MLLLLHLFFMKDVLFFMFCVFYLLLLLFKNVCNVETGKPGGKPH